MILFKLMAEGTMKMVCEKWGYIKGEGLDIVSNYLQNYHTGVVLFPAKMFMKIYK